MQNGFLAINLRAHGRDDIFRAGDFGLEALSLLFVALPHRRANLLGRLIPSRFGFLDNLHGFPNELILIKDFFRLRL